MTPSYGEYRRKCKKKFLVSSLDFERINILEQSLMNNCSFGGTSHNICTELPHISVKNYLSLEAGEMPKI
jgi:hypothetical protein